MTINDNKLQEIIRFKPHENQLPVLEAFDKVRDIAICAGRRWGKSAVCAYLALRVLLQDDKKIWIVSPNYDLSQKVFNYVVKWFAKIAPSQVRNISYRPNPKIKTDRGSLLECKSAENPTGLLGEELDLIIVDEASRVPKNVWDAYLFPTTASRKGKTVFISTPFGKNWFYQKYLELKEDDDGASFHYTSRDNPTSGFPQEEWDRAKEKLPEMTFKQDYEALFLDDAASAIRGVNKVVTNKDDIFEDARADRRYVMGVDLAKLKDFSVLTVIDTYTHNMVYFDRFKDIDFPMQKARISATAKRYNGARLIIDSTGIGDPITDDLKREGLMIDDIKLSNKSKQQIIQKLAIYVEQQAITIPDIDVLVDELGAYAYEMTEFGKIRYAAPAGMHDDCVISLALAVWGLDSTKKNNPSRLFRTTKRKKIGYEFR